MKTMKSTKGMMKLRNDCTTKDWYDPWWGGGVLGGYLQLQLVLSKLFPFFL